MARRPTESTSNPPVPPVGGNSEREPELVPEIRRCAPEEMPRRMLYLGNRYIAMWIRWLPEHRETLACLWLDPEAPVQALPPMEVEDAHRKGRWSLQAVAHRIRAHYLPYHQGVSWADQVLQAADQLMQHRAFAGAVPVTDPEVLQAGAQTQIEINPTEWQFQGDGKSWKQVPPEQTVQFRVNVSLTYLGPVEG